MATMTSHIATSIRGSVGGLTYQSGRGHPIVCRAKSPNWSRSTPALFSWQKAFSDAVQMWQLMTDEIYESWAAWNDQIEAVNRFNGSKLTARQYFICVQSYALWCFWNGYTDEEPDLNPPDRWGWAPFFVEGPETAGPGTTGFGFRCSNQSDRFMSFQGTISYPRGKRIYSFRGGWDQNKYQFEQVPAGAANWLFFEGLNPDAIYFYKIKCCSVTNPAWIGTTFVGRAKPIVTP